VAQLTGGDPEIQKGQNKMYGDQAKWPLERQASFGIRPEIREFITKARAYRAASARGIRDRLLLVRQPRSP
jgi:hypothetical protein